MPDVFPAAAPYSSLKRRSRPGRRNGVHHSRNARFFAGGLLLASFAVAALVGSLHPKRLVNPLPHQGWTDYEINILSMDRPLTSEQVAKRYHIPFHGSSSLTPHGLRSLVRHREKRPATENNTFVRVHMRPNGGTEEIWLWPEN